MLLFHRWISIDLPTTAWIPHTLIIDIFISLAFSFHMDFDSLVAPEPLPAGWILT